MARIDNIHELPGDIPVPDDDGACDHLPDRQLPKLSLPSTDGNTVNLAEQPGITVAYVYPRTGRPDRQLPTGWNDIPGARGCTPQSCAFRDYHQELQKFSARVFGLSTQDTEYQREAVRRLQLPFPLLSDERLEFASALNLPMFEVDGMTLIKRVTLIVFNGRIEHVFYPVFPPDQNASAVVTWLRNRDYNIDDN